MWVAIPCLSTGFGVAFGWLWAAFQGTTFPAQPRFRPQTLDFRLWTRRGRKGTAGTRGTQPGTTPQTKAGGINRGIREIRGKQTSSLSPSAYSACSAVYLLPEIQRNRQSTPTIAMPSSAEKKDSPRLSPTLRVAALNLRRPWAHRDIAAWLGEKSAEACPQTHPPAVTVLPVTGPGLPPRPSRLCGSMGLPSTARPQGQAGWIRVWIGKHEISSSN